MRQQSNQCKGVAHAHIVNAEYEANAISYVKYADLATGLFGFYPVQQSDPNATSSTFLSNLNLRAMAPVVAYNPRIIEHGLTGIVITSPMDDEFVGAVFVDSTRPLYLMHRELFRIKDDPTMTRSRHIRMEEFFRFGDVIESVCVFRYTDFETTVYSTLFGEIDVDSIQLGGTPYQDVAIRCFVHVDYRGPNDCRFRAIRVKSIEYDDAPLVNDAPWNRSCKSKLPIYDDDSDDNYDPLGLSKPKTKREDILYKKQGKIRERKNVEDPVEVYCPPHKRERFVIGFFRTQDQNIAPETWIKFDAFWNDKTRCYIIQQYEVRGDR
ncbi:hypothetical protein QR680_007491 [Steinernema hermaphroditum]|uniref:Uncharacterized protein n=1 Tax=Steinernema hermaphroditum TaxID=289476 RepID=A0AA39IER4_9BILA|nr:hypothetical protein QR680_007491 [Steinernema hermaphroditum]